jgi:hypothetical protein
MSTILAKDTKRAWERRVASAQGERFDPTVDSKPKDWWAVSVLWRSGHLTRIQYNAAKRLDKLQERAFGAGRSEGGAKVDTGLRDPHPRMWDKAVSAREAENAMHSVRRQLGELPTIREAFERAFEFPRLSVREVSEGAKESVGGRLGSALDLLAFYFDGIDDDRARYMGLDEPHKNTDTFGQDDFARPA